MSYPGWGFLVVLGVAIGSAIYYYFNNDHEANRHRYDYGNGEAPRNQRRFATGSYDENCTICLDTIDSYTTIRILHCGHTFHEHCITMWLNQKRLCPICRITI